MKEKIVFSTVTHEKLFCKLNLQITNLSYIKTYVCQWCHFLYFYVHNASLVNSFFPIEKIRQIVITFHTQNKSILNVSDCRKLATKRQTICFLATYDTTERKIYLRERIYWFLCISEGFTGRKITSNVPVKQLRLN